MLKGKRKKLDKNKDGKLSSIDFALLRKKKKLKKLLTMKVKQLMLMYLVLIKVDYFIKVKRKIILEQPNY